MSLLPSLKWAIIDTYGIPDVQCALLFRVKNVLPAHLQQTREVISSTVIHLI